MEDHKHKRGDTNADGMVFWRYSKSCINGEWWVSRDKFVSLSETSSIHAKKCTDRKRLSFETKVKNLRQGDTRSSDDKIFWGYTISCKNGEDWITPTHYSKRLIAKRRQVNSYLKTNKGKEYQRGYKKQRRTNDPLYKIADLLRARIRSAFKQGGYKKSSRSCKILGCSFSDLQAHLERQFEDGMSWDNMGDWHIDHRLPLSAAKNKGELLLLCRWENLQPLWAADNIRKSDSFCMKELVAYLSH